MIPTLEILKERARLFRTDGTQPLINYPKVRMHGSIALEAYAWCQEQFGDNWVWSSPIQTNYTEIYFIHPEDAFLTRLKFPTITT
jgi:hypothetical protein